MENIENIEVLYGSLSDESKETILLYTKLIAAGEANARKASDGEKRETSINATVR